MAQVFLLQNQYKGLLNKRGEWSDGREARSLFNTLHHDEALNQKIEVNSKDYTLRITLLECERSDKGIPLLKDEDLPPLGSCLTTAPVKVDVVKDAEPLTSEDAQVADNTADEGVDMMPAASALTAEPEALITPVVEADDETAIAAKIEAMLAAQAQLLEGNKP